MLQAAYKVEVTGLRDWVGGMRATGEKNKTARFLVSLIKGPSEEGGDRSMDSLIRGGYGSLVLSGKQWVIRA